MLRLIQVTYFYLINVYCASALAVSSGAFGKESPERSSVPEENSASSLSIDESIVMFYYKDISLVKGFYEDLLQLNKTLDDEWVKIYQITPSSSVGIVQESDAGHHKTQANNAVMLSIVTDDVDAWYKRFKSSKDSVFLKDIYNNEHAPIRAFLVADPGGYTVEIFQWLNR